MDGPEQLGIKGAKAGKSRVGVEWEGERDWCGDF